MGRCAEEPPSALGTFFAEPVRKPFWVTTKGLRDRIGRSPAENAEGAEVYWEGGDVLTPEPFSATSLVC